MGIVEKKVESAMVFGFRLQGVEFRVLDVGGLPIFV